ncbi:hypothetical protein [Streptomyces sp. NPDC093261]|uniref:hypothetical protein n=1 Tax=Streptomyces sp. NPDC093261 TaxID=3366037 RepID=UPI00380D267C
MAHARGLPERAVTIALATAIQESKLRNLTYGDRDSIGLFQQRPSQGWGSPAQIRDPVYASGRFFDALVKVPDYVALPVTVVAQRVQHSGYPEAYAQHEDMATTLADVLTGREGPALSCTVSGTDPVPSDTGGSGAAGVVSEAGGGGGVTAAVRREFGDVPTALPVTGGGSVSYPIPTDQVSTGWSLALWLVCHATELNATSVTFNGRRWSSTASNQGWTHTTPDPGQTGTLAVALS